MLSDLLFTCWSRLYVAVITLACGSPEILWSRVFDCFGLCSAMQWIRIVLSGRAPMVGAGPLPLSSAQSCSPPYWWCTGRLFFLIIAVWQTGGHTGALLLPIDELIALWLKSRCPNFHPPDWFVGWSITSHFIYCPTVDQQGVLISQPH